MTGSILSAQGIAVPLYLGSREAYMGIANRARARYRRFIPGAAKFHCFYLDNLNSSATVYF